MVDHANGQYTLFLGIIPPFLQIINFCISGIGYILLFRKCGVKGYWAYVPVAREYHVSICADKEKEGRFYCIFAGLYYGLELLLSFLDEGSDLYLIMHIPVVAVTVTMAIYMINIYLGLTKVFNRKKRWVFLFIAAEWLAVLIFGASKKFVPQKKYVDYSKNAEAKLVGEDIAPAEEGLTVNIRERDAIDFIKKKTLLKDIHMIIPKGHMVLLLGGSGAGKTTFLNAVTGYEKAKANIHLDKKDVYADYSKMKYDIGFVPQQDLVRGTDTVAMTIADAANMRLSKYASLMEKENRIERMLDQFGLMSVRNNLVEKLSGGQRKRLSIALEFINDPTLFILDEPDSGLDGVVARNLFKSLRDIADSQKIVLVITHTPDRVADLFDDIIILAKDSDLIGRLAFYGPVDECRRFFGKERMEEVVKCINRPEEGGDGRADEFIMKYAEVQHV